MTLHTSAKHIVIAGGTGFLGQELAAFYRAKAWRVSILTRGTTETKNGIDYYNWDGLHIDKWTNLLEGARVLINLSGQTVNCRYHRRNKSRILNSRTRPTQTLGHAIQNCKSPPLVWLNASTATIYEHSAALPNDELTGRIGHGFSVSVGRAWENAFFAAETPLTRKIALRTSMVLGHAKNSVYPVFKRLIRCGAGGKMGDGNQMVSWIHHEDFLRAVDFLIQNDDLSGAINITAPAPVANKTFMQAFRENLRMPFGLPAPAWLLQIGTFLMRTEPELILKSRYVIPTRLLRNRFQFKYPFLDQALENL